VALVIVCSLEADRVMQRTLNTRCSLWENFTGRGLGRLKTLRASKELGLRELAKKAPPGYLAELEAGKKTNPSLDVLRKLA
jgi:hypothetical protein